MLLAGGAVLSIILLPAACWMYGHHRPGHSGSERQPELRSVLAQVHEGRRAEELISIRGGRYRLEGTPVESSGGVRGVVLLFQDVTEREQAERIRREFTANVSHELKTPLHAISGYAELLSAGMVKPEDMPRFAGNIYTEAQRLILLVEDIIRLSQLDEGAAGMGREQVNLAQLLRETGQQPGQRGSGGPGDGGNGAGKRVRQRHRAAAFRGGV